MHLRVNFNKSVFSYADNVALPAFACRTPAGPTAANLSGGARRKK